MKRRLATPHLQLCLVLVLLAACTTAPLEPGQDPVLVRAQQTYETARESANLLFVIEDEHEALIEAKLPGTHKLVEKLRLRIREDLPRLLRAIDAYGAARDADKNDLLTALAVGEQFLAEVQTILANSQGVLR